MTENDFDRTARLWLDDGPTAMSDRALQAALDEIHVTRQRRAWWPARRIFDMNSTIRLAIGAAAVVVAGVIGINFLPGGSGAGGGPAATPTPAPTPTPTPIPLPPNGDSVVVTELGTYLAGDPFPIPVTITLPAGWLAHVGGPYAVAIEKESGRETIAFTLSQNIFADPCNGQGFLDPQPGPTVDDLASALASLPGFDVATPTEVTVDGYRGKQLTLTAPDNFDGCTLTSEGYRVWRLPLGAVFSFTPGERMALWIVDVNGERLVISSETYPATTAEELAEVQEILDSIRIENPN
jgi:hypothetical protein